LGSGSPFRQVCSTSHKGTSGESNCVRWMSKDFLSAFFFQEITPPVWDSCWRVRPWKPLFLGLFPVWKRPILIQTKGGDLGFPTEWNFGPNFLLGAGIPSNFLNLGFIPQFPRKNFGKGGRNFWGNFLSRLI